MKQIIFAVLITLSFCLNSQSQPSASSTTDSSVTQDSKRKTVVITRLPEEKEKHYKMIPLKTMGFETVEAACRPMLSEGGLLVNEKSRNSVLVYDNEDVIKKITEFVNAVDRDSVNIRIEVDYISSSSKSDKSISIKTTSYKDKEGLQTGKVEVKPVLRKSNSSASDKQIIVVSEGVPATIFYGKTVIDPTWIQSVVLVPDVSVVAVNSSVTISQNLPDIQWTDVGAALRVLPVLYDDDVVELEFYPSLSYLEGKGIRKYVKVQNLASRVKVKNGQRLYVGGVMSSKADAYSNIFGLNYKAGDSSDRSVSDMYVTVYILKAGDARAGRPSMRGPGN